MSSELIGELGQVVGMGLDGGLVHSEVVVMGEELVVSSGTVVYQEDVPGVITCCNMLMSEETSEPNAVHTADGVQQVEFTTATVNTLSQAIVTSSSVSPAEVITTITNLEKNIVNTPVKHNASMSLEELGCHDNNTMAEEEVQCDGIDNNLSAKGDKQLERNESESPETGSNKSYALDPDPGTATRRGGPGPTKRQSQRYRKAWEQFPEFKDWLCSHHNVYRAICKICNRVLLADFTVIKAHATSRKHTLLMDKYMKLPRSDKRLLSLNCRTDGYIREAMDPVTNPTDDVGMIDMTATDYIYTEDFYHRISDPGKVNGGAGSGGSQSLDNTDGNFLSVIYTPNQRNIVSQMVSKAIVMSPAPNWKATAIVNGHVTRLDLSDYVGRYLILVFYPQDFSKVCASEINALSDRSFEFRSVQAEIVACSVDSHLAHLTWCKLSRADGGVSLPKIPLIADPTHAISRAYGVLLPDKGHTLRAHFIIDKRGILRHMSVTDTLVGRGIDELFRLVKALQYVDDVEEPVPADWTQPNE